MAFWGYDDTRGGFYVEAEENIECGE